MANGLTRNKLLLTTMVICLICFSFVQIASASVSATSQTKFYYDNGTFFTNPGIYFSVTRVSNVWYFNNQAYQNSSSSDDAVGIAIAFGMIAIAVSVVMPIILLRQRQNNGED